MIGAIPPVGDDDELLRRAEMLALSADAVVCVVGTSAEWETEGHDRASMNLPGLQDQLVRRLALANSSTIVLVNAGSPVTMDWAEDTAVLAQIWFGGEQAGEGVADVLLGDTDPGGRLPTTIPYRIEDTPAFPFYPGSGGTRLPTTKASSWATGTTTPTTSSPGTASGQAFRTLRSSCPTCR